MTDVREPPVGAGPEPIPAGRRSALRVAAGVLSGIALAAVVVLALVMIVMPLALRATPYTVLTGSMRPTIDPGSLVVVRPKPVDDIQMGDVVTYQRVSASPEVVTHRVVGLGWTSTGERQFVTRGDANNAADPPVRAVQIRGVVAYHLPYLGYVNTWVGINRPGWLLKAVAGALILYGLVLVGGGVRDRFRRGRPDETTTDEPSDAAVVVPDVTVAYSNVVIERASPSPTAPSRRARSETRDRDRRRSPAPGAVVTVVVLCGLVVGLAILGRRSR